MSHLSTRSQPRTILYVAATEDAAHDGAAGLERVDSGPDRSVQPTVDVEAVRERASSADCVVFAETPTTAAGAHLLEVVDACDSTPLVLFTDAAYGSSAARSTEGVDGYVRRDTAEAAVHLADEIDWVCRGADAESGGRADPDSEGRTDSDSGRCADHDSEGRADDDAVAEPTPDGSPEPPSVGELLEVATELAACRDRERGFELFVDAAADVFDLDYCWFAAVDAGEFVPQATTPAVPDDALERTPLESRLGDAFRAGESVRIDDLDDRDGAGSPFDGVRSLYSVPVAEVGVFRAAAEPPSAFDGATRELLERFCAYAGAVLERDRVTTRGADERGRLAELFANVPEPALRYEIDDGEPIVRDVNDAFEDAFGVDRETVVGDPVGTSTVPSGFEDRTAALAESLRSGERRQFPRRRETADGVREFVLTHVPLESEPDGHNPEGVLVHSDVTESNRRERELADATGRLERVGSLVAEEVRTPLNVARGYLELAEETGDREHFAEIERAHRRLLGLVERLDGVAREDAVVVDTEPVSVRDAARRAWVGLDTGGARLVTDADLVLEADPVRLRELFEYALQAVVEGGDGRRNWGDGRDEGGRRDGGDGEPVTVTVGSTDDGFYVAGQSPGTGDPEGAPANARLVAADGTDFQLGLLERIADAHGWEVGVAADEDGIAFAFRGVAAVNPSTP